MRIALAERAQYSLWEGSDQGINGFPLAATVLQHPLSLAGLPASRVHVEPQESKGPSWGCEPHTTSVVFGQSPTKVARMTVIPLAVRALENVGEEMGHEKSCDHIEASDKGAPHQVSPDAGRPCSTRSMQS